MEAKPQNMTTGLTADIVSAFVSNNSVPAGDLPKLIEDVHRALLAAPMASAQPVPPTPAVPIRQSVRSDYITCLEDSQKFKSLRRHLRVHGLTAEEYRTKWGLPRDYPMVAPNYAKVRSELAKSIGLGKNRNAHIAKKPTPARKRAKAAAT